MMQLTTLANGLRVATRTSPGAETAAVALHAEAGSRHETADQNGLAHLFEHMVFKGAGGRSAREISEAIEDVGGDLNAATDRDSTVYSLGAARTVSLGVSARRLVRWPAFTAAEIDGSRGLLPNLTKRAHAQRYHFDDLQTPLCDSHRAIRAWG